MGQAIADNTANEAISIDYVALAGKMIADERLDKPYICPDCLRAKRQKQNFERTCKNAM